jgi:non-ribosomal peptide synthetase component F
MPESLFQALARHARLQPDAIACASRFRLASYRKLWSRVERATARLQGEWRIRPGDIVAYQGHGHPDAIVLFVALARCGAVLLPLEHPASRAAFAGLAERPGLALALFDDELDPGPDASRIAPAAFPLSTLIGQPCPYRATVAPPDTAACSLLRLAGDGSLRPLSLDQLGEETAGEGREVHGALFDANVFGPVVLSALHAGDTLTWR